VEQELLTLLEHLSSPPAFSGVHVHAQSLAFCVLCLLLMASDYPFDIFKLFLDLQFVERFLKLQPIRN
jgi:hypothetical protein